MRAATCHAFGDRRTATERDKGRMNVKTMIRRALPTVVPMGLLVLASSGPAHAMKLTIDSDTAVDVDVMLSYGTGWRTTGQNDKLLADINGDDGDRNFRRGSMINNRLGAVVDFDAHHKDFGFFMRPRAYYDFAYTGSNDHDSPATNNNGPANGGPNADNNSFTAETRDRHGRKAEILDAFAYGKGKLGGTDLVGRVGRQVVSWGESLFLQGGISSAQSPLDATAANVPGVELRDIFLPVGQASVLGKWGSFSLASYYQWEWAKTRLDESGSFFSNTDMLDAAGHHILAPTPVGTLTLDRGDDKKPGNGGQYGIAARYVVEGLRNTEFGAYFVNYHEKIPMVIGKAGGGSFSKPFGSWANLPTGAPAPNNTLGAAEQTAAAVISQLMQGGLTQAQAIAQIQQLGLPVPGTADQLNYADTFSYHLEYAKDVKLYGASFSTVLFGANVAGEVSYRHRLPVKVTDPNPLNLLGFTYREANVIQAQVSGIYVLPRSFLWDGATFIGEVGFNRVNGLSNDVLFKDPTGRISNSNDKFAWGYVGKFTFDYHQVLNGVDLQVPITYKGNPRGVSSVPGTFAKGQDSLGVGLDFTYQGLYKFGVAYTAFLNGPEQNPKADRDFVSAYLKYTF